MPREPDKPAHEQSTGWQEALRRIEEARRNKAYSLDLSGLRLKDVPDSLAQLTHLTELDLSGNQITAVPNSLAQLPNLTTLQLYVNQIIAIPDSLAQLTNLKTLYLNNNQITAIPDSLAQLTTWRYSTSAKTRSPPSPTLSNGSRS